MQIVWPTIPGGWKFNIAGPNSALLVTGGATIVVVLFGDICRTTTGNSMPAYDVKEPCR